MKFFLFVFLFISHYSWAQTVPETTGSMIKTADAQKVLNHHNKARAEVRLGKLLWSLNLAAYAQEWANHLAVNKKCRLVHSDCIDNKGSRLGENLFWCSSAEAYGPLDASISWYEEKFNYNGSSVGSPGWNGNGHYTQMVWKTTKEVGVGVAYCQGGGIIVVASYFPAGNMVGEYPY